MSLEKVNILSVELGEQLEEAGFRHAATSVGERLGAAGASEPVELVREPRDLTSAAGRERADRRGGA